MERGAMPDNALASLILEEVRATKTEVVKLRDVIEGPSGLRQELTETRGRIDTHIELHKDREKRESDGSAPAKKDTGEFSAVAAAAGENGIGRGAALLLTGAAIGGAAIAILLKGAL